MIIRFFVFFILVIVFNFSCQEKPDIGAADSLITTGKYEEALDILRKGQYSGGLNTEDKQRISTRILKIERILFFRDFELQINNTNWPAAVRLADSLKKVIDKLSPGRFEPYNFDYYYIRSRLDSAQAGIDAWKSSLEKALNFHTAEFQREQFIYEKLAFYYAGKEEFTKAREQLDKSIRRMNITKMDPQLKGIFYNYMEGRFLQAYDQLIKVDEKDKDVHWQSVQQFLHLYRKSLTMHERFKLW